MKDWMKWGLAGGVIGILAPLAMGPGLEGTNNVFYFYGLTATLATKLVPENLWHTGLWTFQFLLGFLVANAVGYLYGRHKK